MRNWPLLFLFLVLIVATFLRLYQLEIVPPGLYPDEAMNGNNALEALRTGEWKVYYPENNGREGLFINVQALFLALIEKNEPWALRLPSAVFGILTVLGLYFLAKELFEKRIALLSSFLLATSVWHLIFSRIGFRAIMAPFLLVWALYFLLKAFKNRSGSQTVYAAAAGVCFGLGFYTYIAYRIMPLLLLLFIPFFRREPRFWRLAGIFAGIAVIVAMPIGLYYLQHPADFFGRTGQLSILASETPLRDLALNTVKTLGMFHFTGDWNPRHNLAGRPQLFWPVGILFLIGLVIGLRRLREFRFSMLFGWFLLAMLPVVISNEGLPHALRAILMALPVFLFAGVGGVWGYERLRRYARSFWLPAMTGVFLLLLFFEAYTTYFERWAKNPDTAHAFSATYVKIGREINARPSNVPAYVVVEARGVEVRGLPMPAQTVMFITDSFSEENQKRKNIHYLLPEAKRSVPPGGLVFYIK